MLLSTLLNSKNVFAINLNQILKFGGLLYVKPRTFSTANDVTFNWLTIAERNDFLSVLPQLLKDLTEDQIFKNKSLENRITAITRVLEYNVTQGKNLIALGTIGFYNAAEDTNNLTDRKIHLINILGWCTHMINTSFVIIDDLLDLSKIRRGVPCRYFNEEIVNHAIIDATWLNSAIYVILKKYFYGHNRYVEILEMFHKIRVDVLFGQTIDVTCSGNDWLETFNLDKYNTIVKYKSIIPCKFVVSVAMNLCERYNEAIDNKAKNVFSDMGYFCQVQNDFLDCYGDSSVTGKKGTDIQYGRCTWLVVHALERVSMTQKRILEKHYGKENLESVNAIRRLYKDLELPEAYAKFRDLTFKRIQADIHQIPQEKLRRIFLVMLQSIYKETS